MNLKQLYLDTADYLDANPDMYEFSNVTVPKCGSPGCVIGLMAMIYGGWTGKCIGDFTEEILNDPWTNEFYTMMEDNRPLLTLRASWVGDAKVSAKCLRNAAKKMLDEKPLPNWNEIAKPADTNKGKEHAREESKPALQN